MSNSAQNRKIVFSGIQPSGVPTLGNYLGAIKNWAGMQESFECIYCVVDLHAITVRQNPETLNKNILGAYALLMACGIDPEKSTLFIQSHVNAHSNLAWILNCYTQFGELSRMTQFKDKSATHADNINAGLFDYPALMAADILLYDAHFVPVGQDQKQHLELTRDVAVRFNSTHGDTFVIPEPYIPKEGAKIMSLADPTKKMSKSDSNPNGFISILDDTDTIIKKFKRAITDSEAVVRYGEGKDGVNNLMTIYSAITGQTYEQIEADFAGKGYGDFKNAVGEVVAAHLEPIRIRYTQLLANPDELAVHYRAGAVKASAIADKTLKRAYEKVGFII